MFIGAVAVLLLLISMRSHFYALVVAALIAAGAAPATDRSAPPTLAEARLEERRSIERQMSDYPALPTTALGDAVSFRMNKNDLAIYTRLAPTGGMSRVSIPELQGLSSIDIRGAAAPAGEQYTPFMVLFIH